MFKAVQENSILNKKLTSTSKTAIWRLTIYVVAVCSWTLEKLYDVHKSIVENFIANLKPHSLLWYRNKAKAFQYGHSLLQDSDSYAVIDEKAKIVKFAAATETRDSKGAILKIKVAKDNNGTLAELDETESQAFTHYMGRVKDAGVKLRIVSQEADHLRLTLLLYYDPLVLDNTGARLDGTASTSIQDAIANYLENLPFDGEYSNMALTDALQAVDGAVIPEIISAEAKWGEFDWSVIPAIYNPEAGWLKVYEGDLNIIWKPYGQAA